jgi:tetratricopeptide (TPR) repeat protein
VRSMNHKKNRDNERRLIFCSYCGCRQRPERKTCLQCEKPLQKRGGWYTIDILRTSSLIAIFISIIALIANFPNYDFVLSLGHPENSSSPGDVIQNTIDIANNKPITWWTHGLVNRYPFQVKLNVKQQPADVLIAFVPYKAQSPPYHSDVHIGIKPNSTIKKYELEIEGVGGDGIKRSCTYYLTPQQVEGNLDNKSKANKWAEVGKILINDGYRCFDALPWFNESIELDNESASYWEGQADCLAGLGRYPDALISANEALSKNRENGTWIDDETARLAFDVKGAALSNIGDFYKKKGYYNNALTNYTESINCLDNATSLRPDYYWQAFYWKGRTYNGIGQVYSEKGDYVKALKNFNNAINLSPNDSEIIAIAWHNKGMAFEGLGRTPEAQVAFGNANALWGHYNKALMNFTNAIEINLQYADAWYNKGLALKSLGRTTEADDAFAKAKELGYTG